MAYGTLKVDTLTYNDSGSDVSKTVAAIAAAAPAASPTFTGTVTIPTPAANDNTTKAASTAYVQTELGDYLTTATATSTYAPKASPALTGTATGVNLTLSGNLTVNGTTTTVATTNTTVTDNLLELNSGASSNANDAGHSGFLHLFEPSSTTFVKHFVGNMSSIYRSGAPGEYETFVAGYMNTTSAVAAIQFKMSSGDIDAGTMKMYGVV